MKLDPFAQWGKVFEMWQKLTDDSIARATAFCAEVEKAEAKRVEFVGFHDEPPFSWGEGKTGWKVRLRPFFPARR